MTTKTYKPYQVVVVPFPFTDFPQAKKRPALVISSEAHQKATGQVTLMMITSAKHSEWRGDHLIEDLQKAGLPAASYVRLKIFTLDLRLIMKQVGELSDSDERKVRALLKAHFEL